MRGISAGVTSTIGANVSSDAGLAQSVELFSCKEVVIGSIPIPGSIGTPLAGASSIQD